ncbi:glycosyltransferase family 69 protein [Stipitochalara longipes BDJ]|nr:glycosyltransferase family 69 protein [Stipitochalara longipes BDJ]
MLTGSWPPRKRLSVAAIAIAIIIVFTTISNLHYRSSDFVVRLRLPSYNKGNDPTEQEAVGNATLLELLAPSYIKAILDPKDKEFDRLQCPAPTPKRYDYLQVDRSDAKNVGRQIKYFFALNLRQCIGILPRLMGSIVETVRFLGPENCALSIVEGNSDDGTLEILAALRKDLGSLGLEFHFQTSGIDPKHGDRIEALAALRNLALEPLVNNPSHYSPDTAVIFLNDVAICMDDILELVHQRVFQEADMTCALDWSDINPAPIFYDIWVARAINGDTFWEIPADGGWRFASNLFWNHPTSRQRYDEHKAFQVFACWNGAVVFSAKPIIQNKIRFRRSKPDECYAGEPRLFCKDLWMEGYSKIAVVPSVNLEYSDKSATKVKGLHGYVSEAVKGEDVNDGSLRIAWDTKPPEQVKCMASFEDQSWVPWNQGFETKISM